MKIRFLVGLIVVLLTPSTLDSQARSVTAPVDDYLLKATQAWGRESELGDLSTQRMTPKDLEVRLWGGYGLAGTTGLIVRRSSGRWLVWQADVHTCRLVVSMAVGDTLSDESIHRYKVEARRNCKSLLGGAGTVISVDTLALRPLTGLGDLMGVWQAAVDAGMLSLPPEIPRTWMMNDGYTYVVEVRRGDEYRASVIECTQPPETEGDRRVRRVAAVLAQRIKPDWPVCR